MLTVTRHKITPGDFAHRLRDLRVARGLTPSQLAYKVGVSENAIRRLELGYSKKPSSLTAVRLAKELGVTESFLVTGSEVSTMDEQSDLEARVTGLERRQTESVAQVEATLGDLQESLLLLARFLEERGVLTQPERAQLLRRLGSDR